MSHVTCHMPQYIYIYIYFFNNKLVELVGEVYVIQGPFPIYLRCVDESLVVIILPCRLKNMKKVIKHYIKKKLTARGQSFSPYHQVVHDQVIQIKIKKFNWFTKFLENRRLFWIIFWKNILIKTWNWPISMIRHRDMTKKF